MRETGLNPSGRVSSPLLSQFTQSYWANLKAGGGLFIMRVQQSDMTKETVKVIKL